MDKTNDQTAEPRGCWECGHTDYHFASCSFFVARCEKGYGPVRVLDSERIPAPAPSAPPERFDMLAHLSQQREWSERTFGPGARTAGVLDHIRKELTEIEKAPLDLSEWIDVVILALDGAWRAGHLPHEIIAALRAKQAKNEARTWPDWRTQPNDKAIEHDRSADTRAVREDTRATELIEALKAALPYVEAAAQNYMPGNLVDRGERVAKQVRAALPVSAADAAPTKKK